MKTTFVGSRWTIVLAGLLSAFLFLPPSSFAQSRLPQIQQQKEVRFGWGEFRPYESRDVVSGQLQGPLIDMADELAKSLGANPKFVLDSWPTLPAGIAANRFDLVIMGYSDGRAQTIDFSRPLYTAQFTALSRADSGVASWDQLNVAGRKIAVTTGSSSDEQLMKLEKQGGLKAEVVRIRDVGAAILALQSHNVDGYVNQRDVLSLMAKARGGELKVLAGSFGDTWFGVALPKGDPALRQAVNKAIGEMIGANYIAQVLAKYNIDGAQQAK
ncbi:substrate-binding periplasmic protein [Paraburkholderia sp.]|uniref:substrate-binding periplasmic protein n=1 Tax=Paraburkholderia sp. TaxID=1926495 RepID=UPI0039E3D7A3